MGQLFNSIQEEGTFKVSFLTDDNLIFDDHLFRCLSGPIFVNLLMQIFYRLILRLNTPRTNPSI